MAKKANLLRNILGKRKEEADKRGWSIGLNILTIDPDLAYNRLSEAGLTVYRDNEHIWGPASESWQAMQILANNGDALSEAAIGVHSGLFTWEELGITPLEGKDDRTNL